MVSSGIFILPGIAHARAGPGVILAYLAAGIIAGIGILNTAELATAMPRAGGDYFFITRSLGPAIGSIAGLLNWFTLSLKSAFALVGMAAFARLFVDIDPRITGITLTCVFVVVNLAGTKHAGRAQVIFVIGLLGLMAFYIIRGLPEVEMVNLVPFQPYGFGRTLATAGFVFVAYGGLIQISGLAEEIRRPARTIPLSMFLSLAVVTVLYTLMVFVTTGVMPSEALDNSLTPITDGAALFLGPWGTRLLGLAAILAFVSTANAGIMSASRYLYALSRDDLLPRRLGRLGKRTGAPVLSLIVTGGFVSAALFLKLDILVEAASLVLILGFILSSICVIILRESRIQNYRPSFRAPFYPVPQLLGLFCFGLLIFELGVEAYIICAVLIGIGVAGYWIFGKKRINRDYALLHLVKRITSREMISDSLDGELKEIIRERDEITSDRFDELVAASAVLDLDRPASADECFSAAADCLAERLQLGSDKLAAQFRERESDTSTVITPSVAIPHIIIPGEHRFEIVLVRARQGVSFSEEFNGVRAVFFLAGTLDERNTHLRVLAAIAQIIQASDFLERWLAAHDEQGIRDVVHLGRRLRTGGHRVKSTRILSALILVGLCINLCVPSLAIAEESLNSKEPPDVTLSHNTDSSEQRSGVLDNYISPEFQSARELHLRGVEGDEEMAERALETLEDLNEEDPDNPFVLAYLGSAKLLAAKRAFFPWNKSSLAEEGLLLLDRAVSLAPDNLEIRFVRGISSYPLPASFDRHESACADFAAVAGRAEEAVPAGKMDASLAAKTFYYHGLCLEENGRRKDARASWDKAAAIAPGSPFALLAEEKTRNMD